MQVSADPDRFKFTTVHLKYLKRIAIILSIPTRTSCPCRQSNYFYVFPFAALKDVPLPFKAACSDLSAFTEIPVY